MICSLAGATVVVPDLDLAIAAYRDFLGYVGPAPGLVGVQLAEAWGVAKAGEARMAVLRPASGEPRFLRLVEGRADPSFAPLRTLGWTAIEIVVEDLAASAERLSDSPFRIIGAPAVLDFDFTDALSAMQVVGPGGEILYLTQIDAEIPGFDLPRAHCAVGQMFITVLAAGDLAEATSFYAAAGRPAGPVFEARIEILTEAYGLPAGQRHRLTTIALGDNSLIEVDAFPKAAAIRPMSDIGLPSGIAMVSFHVSPEMLRPGEQAIIIGAANEWIERLI